VFATAIYFHLSLPFAGLPFAWNPISRVHYEKFYMIDSSGLDYKHVMIKNDDSSVINKRSFKLIGDARVVIYNCNRFIIQATEVSRTFVALCTVKNSWLNFIIMVLHSKKDIFLNYPISPFKNVKTQ
jgi:hypothetical protein